MVRGASEWPCTGILGGVRGSFGESALRDAKVDVREDELDGGKEKGVVGPEGSELFGGEAEGTGPGNADIDDLDRA